MSRAAFWQRGESLDYKNGTTDVIDEGTVISLGTRIGVTGTLINPGETGSLHVVGVFKFNKTGDAEIKMGDAVYYDGTGITSIEAGSTPAGYAAADVEAADTIIPVKLLG